MHHVSGCKNTDRFDEPRPAWMVQVREQARRIHLRSRESHSWDHTLRVARLCERIGASENADRNVLLTAAYLHDIGRQAQDESSGMICHAVEGARMAEPILRPLPLSDDRKTNILHCIRAHRFRGQDIPQTLEARILFDADKLDAIGAVGIARAFQFAGEVGARLHSWEIPVEMTLPYGENDTGYREYVVKLSKIKNRMLTQTGRHLAYERHEFMVKFFERFLKEHEGEI
jgi:uncharacterized protein